MGLRLDGDVVTAARSILGSRLQHGGVTVRITEVEAYDGSNDPASHSYRGQTPRNAVMFGPPGHLYVYFSYGMHWNANVACGPEGRAAGVLLRAGEVIVGAELAQTRRGRSSIRDLARGPARLAQALGITGAHNGVDLVGGVDLMGGPDPTADGRVTLTPPDTPVTGIAQGPRVGVARAADVPWRFWIEGDPFVSHYRRSPRAPREPDDLLEQLELMPIGHSATLPPR